MLEQNIFATFYPFSQFCEINTFLLSLQKQPNTAPNLFQRRVEYGKYVIVMIIYDGRRMLEHLLSKLESRMLRLKHRLKMLEQKVSQQN